MLLFNGVAFEDVAAVNIVDVVVSPITQAVTAVDRAVVPGADFVRIRGKTRTITVTFALLDQDRDARCESMEAIRRWAASDKPQRLMLPDRIGQYIDAICTTFPQLSIREWWEVGQMVFTSYEPFLPARRRTAAHAAPRSWCTGASRRTWRFAPRFRRRYKTPHGPMARRPSR